MLPSAREVFDTLAEHRTQDQRWAAIYYDVRSMANATHHSMANATHHDDGTTIGFTWSRADVEAILAATAGLFVRYTALRRVCDERRGPVSANGSGSPRCTRRRIGYPGV